MKTYAVIDPSDSPIVVLGYGHFFTADSLDGVLGMAEVYDVDGHGHFIGLKDMSGQLAHLVPRCPDCQCPVRQFATNRYNRVINRAVIDEMSKRFLTTGKDDLRRLADELAELEKSLEATREEIVQSVRQAKAHVTSSFTQAEISKVTGVLQKRHNESRKIEGRIKTWRNSVADQHQPAKKLHDATVQAARRAAVVHASLDLILDDLSLMEMAPVLPSDRRVTMGGQMLQIKSKCLILNDKFIIAQALKALSNSKSIKMPGGSPALLAIPFFESCKAFIGECHVENLPKLLVEASLFYASIARCFESFCNTDKIDLRTSTAYIAKAKQLFEEASEVCKQPFHNAQSLRDTVEVSIRLMRRQWYDEVTADELNAIKNTMVQGSQGIASHSGHWYNCKNGHPFAIGECGMPMEQARCPECGAAVGGQNNTPAGGVTRATQMED
ncbi:hypothetical protein GLAREA_07294 [Glarea lozoyensis ATCC 20868]|uniref:RZ-type domain-containing protein n=1 Tax=Glarea lozoyensis (strain ATCC 20868 / MF5171) TaxID=1116229 RepID=S3DJE3_GLAL2|nr:uncharacterized protein GLAREA_07294 [Glarea lozoyensis ATCC 20868]EPE32161.1 hypothetical protein GLAREA_07294 [Glarea lozoyensis ATCC 20868]